MNDIQEGLDSKIRLYADDVTMYIVYDNQDLAIHQMEENLNKMLVWAKQWYVKFNPAKTDCVTFTRKRNHIPPRILMDNIAVKTSDSHKHLGLILQCDGKWGEQMDEMISKAKRRVDILRYLGRKLDRQSLEKLYITFVRPILEYGGVIWNNCQEGESYQLEMVQLSAGRAVCGAKRGTSHQELYRELGWEKLKERRDRQCLVTLHKMVVRQAPETVVRLIPERTRQRNRYNVRSQEHITMPRTTSQAHYRSFLPATIKKWNALSDDCRGIPSAEEFKAALRPEKHRTPAQYLTGERKAQILLCRLRVGNGDLNLNLYERNLEPSPTCLCGAPEESTQHFLMECPDYDHERTDLRNKIGAGIQVTRDLLLKGDPNLTDNTNSRIAIATQEYILETKRFK
jgi:hypothetical protein